MTLPHVARDGYVTAGSTASPGRVVVARSLLRVRVFPLGIIARTDRRSALRAQTLAWQPFPVPAVLVGEQRDSAVAVAWDRPRVTELLRAAGLEADAVELVPEVALRGPGQDGCRLLRGLDGVDAEWWTAGQLQASRWWPEMPDDAVWEQTLRQWGAPATVRPEAIDSRPRAARSGWLRLHPLGDDDRRGSRGSERRLLQFGLLAAVAVSAAVAHQGLDAHATRQALQEDLARADEPSQVVLKARDQAGQARADLERVASPFQVPHAAEVLLHLSRLLPPGVQVLDLEWSHPELRLVLAGAADGSRTQVIRMLQEGGWATDVREMRSRTAPPGALALEMRLKGSQPPAPAAALAQAPAAGPSDIRMPGLPAVPQPATPPPATPLPAMPLPTQPPGR